MRRTELKTCRKCGTIYTWTSGGIVMTPMDHADRGLCPKCRITTGIGNIFKSSKHTSIF